MRLLKIKDYVKSYITNHWDYYSELRLRRFVNSIRSFFKFQKNKDLAASVPSDLSLSYPAIKRIKSRKRNEKIKIVFMCQVPAIWNSIKSIYLTAKCDPDIDAYILALPEKLMHEDYDVSHEEYGENESFAMCSKFDNSVINAYDKNSGIWFDLEGFNPDYVFVPRPYDIHLPPCYRSDELRKYVKICYVVYGGYCVSYWSSRFGYNLNFIKNAYAVFTENNYHCSILRRIVSEILHVSTKIEFLGFPRFDLYTNLLHFNIGRDTDFIKTVLWLPRWTTSESVAATTFFKYKDTILKFFLEHKNIKLICRPHPLMLRNFLSTGEMTQSEVDAFLQIFNEENNFVYDNSPDYMNALVEADFFIADFSSLLVEEFATGKPIIFCGGQKMIKQFDAESKKWATLMYKANDEKELLANIEMLLDDKDIKKASREEYVHKNMKFETSAGERIIDFLKKDFTQS